MRRSVDRLIFAIALSLILVAPVAAQRLRLEIGPREQFRRLEEMRARNGLSDADVRAARKLWGLDPEARHADLNDAVARLGAARLGNDTGPESQLKSPLQLQLEFGVRDAQSILAQLHYLDPSVDVDGKFGPRTKAALEKFQAEHNLRVTGSLDSATQAELRRHELDPLFSDLRSNLSARYRLLDASGNVHYWGDSQQELSLKLNQILSADTGQSVAVELQGFSKDKAEALATSLRLQQRLINRKAAIGILPHFSENGAPREILYTQGIRLERAESERETIELGLDGNYQTKVPYSVRVGEQVQRAAIRIVAATKALIEEFRAILLFRSRSDDFDSQQSLSELVAAARAELKARHPDLTDEQIRVNLIGQFGTIDLGLLRPELSPAWS